jgi:hypothetical protein
MLENVLAVAMLAIGLPAVQLPGYRLISGKELVFGEIVFGVFRLVGKDGRNCSACDILAIDLLDDRIHKRRCKAEDTSEQSSAGDTGRRLDFVIGDIPINRGDNRNMLQRIDHVDEIPKISFEMPGFVIVLMLARKTARGA